MGQAPAVAGRLDLVDAGQQVEGVAGGQVVPELGFLAKDGADVVGQALALAPGHLVQHLGAAGSGVEDADKHLDGGRFAGAVGSDKGDALALFHLKADALDGRGAALHGAEEGTQAAAQAGLLFAGDEGLDQVLDGDDGLAGHDASSLPQGGAGTGQAGAISAAMRTVWRWMSTVSSTRRP